MHQLLLMRHGKAERARADLSDHDRALSRAGRDAALRLRDRLLRLGVEPDVVLVSSARRTRETLDCISFWDEQPNVELLDTLYMAPAARLLDLIRDLRETMRSVLVLGHNPGVHELALALDAGAPAGSEPHRQLADGFPPARLADFVILTPWRDLRASSARLQRVIDPPEAP